MFLNGHDATPFLPKDTDAMNPTLFREKKMFAETTKIELPKTNNGSDLKNLILNGLEEIGRGKISKSGSVSVKPSKGLRKIFTTADVEGAVRKTTTGYKLILDATSGLTVWGWVVLVLFFPIGLLVLFLPNATCGRLKKAMKEAKFAMEESTASEDIPVLETC